MAKAVYGIYTNRTHAEEAVEALREAGFRPQDLSVLLPENVGSKDIGYEKHTKAPEHAAKAGAAGGVLGGAVGWLLGMGALAIPGIGPIVAAGPIMGALAGLGAGSVLGGLAGALTGMGVPEYEAKRYEGRIRSGGALISIHCETDVWTSRAKEMLKHTGAEDVSTTDVAPVSRGNRLEEEPVPVTSAPVDGATVTRQREFIETPVERTPVTHRERIVETTPDRTAVVRDERIVETTPDRTTVVRDERVVEPPPDGTVVHEERLASDPTITRRVSPRHTSEEPPR
jgi:hypothetical protein